MDFNFIPRLYLAQAGIVFFTLFLAWITYRSHLILKTYQPDINLLLSPPELGARLALVGVCLLLAWFSGLPPAQLGLHFNRPGPALALGGVVGGVTVVALNLLTTWSVARFGRRIYSPLVVKNILPSRPAEWVLAPLAMLPAVAMEELLFRSLWLGVFVDMLPAPALIAGTSVLFGLMHLPQGLLGVLMAGLLNVLLSILFGQTGHLLTPLAAHYTINLLQLVVAHYRRDWLESY